ncbi:hypothetical protein [Chamaesiphon sp.]|uniref:hypothetical protein n=1 Tax=Chamaesiphon sp. TaxID=2814140 RepID=UPI0035940125
MARCRRSGSSHVIHKNLVSLFRGNGTFEVLGQGTITIIDPVKLTHTNHPEAAENSPRSLHHLMVHVLRRGDRYNYKQRLVLC